METSPRAQHDSVFHLDKGMKLAAPTLRVKNLEETLSFYERDVGLHLMKRGRDLDGLEVLELGFRHSSDPLLVLRNDPGSRRPNHDSAGLYHYAVLLPDRKGLASTFLAVGKTGASYEGFADHSFSEALYLHDAEMNGMEFYADRPRNAWPDWALMQGSNGSRRFAALNKPLDIDSLMRELNVEERASPLSFPRGAKIGHMHLRVTNLERSVKFYHERLGMDVMAYMPEMGAAFLSVGGYHHHLGLNTWHSQGGSPRRPGEAGLDEFRMVLPDATAVNEVASRFPDSRASNAWVSISDPDGIIVTISS
jgi:catechol 2,3-dioxygenase